MRRDRVLCLLLCLLREDIKEGKAHDRDEGEDDACAEAAVEDHIGVQHKVSLIDGPKQPLDGLGDHAAILPCSAAISSKEDTDN